MKLALLLNVATPQSDNKVANSGPSIFNYINYIENIKLQRNLNNKYFIKQGDYFDSNRKV